MEIKASDIALNWTCPECGQKFMQWLGDIAQSGTAVCDNCGCDCDLDDEVYVKDSRQQR